MQKCDVARERVKEKVAIKIRAKFRKITKNINLVLEHGVELQFKAYLSSAFACKCQ